MRPYVLALAFCPWLLSCNNIIHVVKVDKYQTPVGATITKVASSEEPAAAPNRTVEYDQDEEMSCPVFVMPRLIKVPNLPYERLSAAKTAEQTDDVQLEHIRELRAALIKQQKEIREVYDLYLKSCKDLQSSKVKQSK